MGDASDYADLDRFMRSPKGSRHLESLKAEMEGKSITNVDFENQAFGILTEITLDSGAQFLMLNADMDVNAIRENFQDDIDEQYEKDFPNRRRIGIRP